MQHKEIDIENIRREYKLAELHESEVSKDPIEQFKIWFDQAVHAQAIEVNAMTLATIDEFGFPSARIVLLKSVEERGFIFFTNYQSHKGQDLEANPMAALVFFWPILERQVRIKGIVEKVEAQLSDEYFHSRPIGSQLGAWASPQSEVIDGRTVLENNLKRASIQYGDNIPRPPHWGGYLVIPNELEFWQGRPNRLHDRIRYTKKNGNWQIDRLAP